MGKQLQFRRGPANVIVGDTGVQGELFVDTTNNRLVLQDGVTVGGWPVARLDEVTPLSLFSSSAIATSQNILASGIYVVTTPNITLTLQPFVGLLQIKDLSGAVNPNITLVGTIDNSSNFVIKSAKTCCTLIWSDTLNSWLILQYYLPNVMEFDA